MTVAKYAWVVTVVSLASIATVVAADQRGPTLVDRVRAANDRFHDVAAAVSEGYAPIPAPAASMAGQWASTM